MIGRKILIIEDDPIILYLYRTHFERAGFEVHVAGNGEAGVYQLHQARPDAVILDLMMPKVNGIQVLKSIRSSDTFRRTPVFVFTNVYLSDLAKEAKAAGATKVFDKTTSVPMDVIDAVREALDSGNKLKGSFATSANSAHDKSAAPVSTNGLEYSDPDPEVLRSFHQTAPKTIVALRKTLLALSKSGEDGARITRLSELYEQVHTFASGASAAGSHVVAQMSAALEALLLELSGKPEQVNVSALRTVSHAIDFLDVLFTKQKTDPESSVLTPLQFLIVDDEIISRKAVIAALDKARLKWTEAGSPDLALSLLKNKPFDTVFLDVSMPEMDGFELCLELRRLPNHKNTPVVFVTGSTDFESRSRSTLSGGTDLIAKPFLFTELAVKALNYGLKYRLSASARLKTESAPSQKPQRPKEAATPIVLSELRDTPAQNPLLPNPETSAEVAPEHSSCASEGIFTEKKSNLIVRSPGGEQTLEQPVKGQNSEHSGETVTGTITPSSVLTIDETGTIKKLNEAAARLFGGRISDLTGKHITSLLIEKDEKNNSFEALTKLFAGTSSMTRAGGQFLAKRKDGSTFLLNLSLNEIGVGGQRMFTGIVRELAPVDPQDPPPPSTGMPPLPVGSALERLGVGQEQNDGTVASEPPAEGRGSQPPGEPLQHAARVESSREDSRLNEDSSQKTPVSDRTKKLLGRENPIQSKATVETVAGDGLIREKLELEARLKDQAKLLAHAQAELEKEILERQRIGAQAKDLALEQSELSKELERCQQAEKSLIRAQKQLEISLQAQSDALSMIQAEVQSEQGRRRQAEAQAKEIDAAHTLLTKELLEQRQTEDSWRRKYEEIETALARQAGELSQTRTDLQKATQEREQIEARAHKLASTYAGLPQELIERKKLEERLRCANQELQAGNLAQSNDFAKTRDEFVKANERRQQLELQVAGLAAVQTTLRGEVASRNQLEQTLRHTNNDLQLRLEKHLANFEQIQSELQKQVKEHGLLQARATELAAAKEALAHQLAEHQQNEQVLRKQQEELETRLATRDSQVGRVQAELEKQITNSNQLQSELQKQVKERGLLQARATELAAAKEGLAHQLAEHQKNEQALRKHQEELEARLATRDSQVGRVQAELEKQITNSNQLQSELQKQVKERGLLQARATELAAAKEALAHQLAEHQQNEQALRKQQEELETRLATRDSQVGRVQAELEKQITNSNQLQSELQKQVKERGLLQARATELAAAKEALAHQLAEHQQNEQVLLKQQEELETRLATRDSQVGSVQAELEKQITNSNQLQSELQKQVKERGLLQARAGELAAAKEALAHQLAEHQKNEQALRKHQEELETRLAKRDSQIGSVQAELEKQISSSNQVQSELQKQVKERGLLQARAGELAAAKEALAHQLAEHQKNEQALRKHQGELEARLTEKTSLVESLHAELEKKALEQELLVATVENAADRHTALTAELSERISSEARLRQDFAKLESLLENQTQELGHTQSDLQTESQAHQEARDHATRLTQAQAVLNQELSEGRRTEEDLRSTQNQLQLRLGGLNDELLEAQTKLRQEVAQCQQAITNIQQLEKVQQTLTAELSELKRTEAAQRQEYSKLQTLRKAQDNDLARLRSDLGVESEARQKSIRETTELNTARAALLQEIAKSKQVEESLRVAQVELQTRLSKQTTALAEAKNELNQESSLRKELEKSTSDLARTRNSLESELCKRESEAEALKGALEKAESQIEVQEQQLSEAQTTLSRETEGHQRAKQQIEELVKTQDVLNGQVSQFRRDEEAWTCKKKELETAFSNQSSHFKRVQSELDSKLEVTLADLSRTQNELLKEADAHSQAVFEIKELRGAQVKLEDELTDRRKAEATLRDTQRELEASLQVQSRESTSITEQLKKAGADHQRQEDQISKITGHSARLAKELSDNKHLAHELERAKSKAEASLALKMAELNEAELKLRKEGEEHQRAAQRVVDLIYSKQMIEEELSKQTRIGTALRLKHEELDVQLERRSGELGSTNARLEAELAEVIRLKDQAKGLLKSEANLKKEIAERKNTEEALRRKQTELDENLRQREAEQAKLQSDLQMEAQNRAQTESDFSQARYATMILARAKTELLENFAGKVHQSVGQFMSTCDILLNAGLKEEHRKSAESLKASAEKLFGLDQEIAQLANVEVTPVVFEDEVFDVYALVEGAIGCCAALAASKGTELASIIHQDVPSSLRGDPNQIKRILLYLLNPSIETPGSTSPTVNVRIERHCNAQSSVGFSVTIDPASISERFQRYLLLPASAGSREFPIPITRDRSELDIAIAKQLVEMMGGQFRMERVDNKSALISFTLQPASLPQGWERTEPMTHHIAGKRILVIEEKESRRELLKAQLIAGGLRSSGVTNGVDALALLRQEAGKRDPFAAAISTVQMPDMHAVTFAKILKSDPELGSTHLLVSHTLGEKLEMGTYQKAGVEASISKPVQQSQLFSILARLLAGPSPPTEHSNKETLDLSLTKTMPIIALQASSHLEIQTSSNGS